jgi:3-keto-5-aminohexanoate cleavage enzyme
VEELLEAMRTLPENCILGIIAGGDTQWEVMAVAIALGVHVRIGMEDNMYLSKDVLATSNAKLVEKIANIARELNRPIATAAEAREMLGISGPRHYS